MVTSPTTRCFYAVTSFDKTIPLAVREAQEALAKAQHESTDPTRGSMCSRTTSVRPWWWPESNLMPTRVRMAAQDRDLLGPHRGCDPAVLLGLPGVGLDPRRLHGRAGVRREEGVW